MTSETKLARILQSITEAGIDALVMGGHAVRYYGVDRNTIDFDMVTAVATPDELRTRLPAIPGLATIREEPVWRRDDFIRFEIGKLPDGREEWLEFWIRNHLLSDFATLKARSEAGNYGGRRIRFLGLVDLMRSKETERESDWQDIALLEEILDDRNRVAIGSAPRASVNFLSALRSRRGMDFAISRHFTDDRQTVTEALTACTHPVTCAFLFPFVREQALPPIARGIEGAAWTVLSSVTPGSPKHFAVVEIVRRNYKTRWTAIAPTNRCN